MMLTWADFKALVSAKNLSIQYVNSTDRYLLSAVEGSLSLQCILDKNNTTDCTDFTTNFQPNGNKSLIQSTTVQTQPPYGSKVITVGGVTKSLYARNTGLQFTLAAGANTLTYTATYAWAKMLGVEAINCEALDTVDFKVYDTAAGTYSGHPNLLLNQFAYAVNLPKDYYQRFSQFDADLYAGMVISMTYTSVSAKTIGINFLLDEVK